MPCLIIYALAFLKSRELLLQETRGTCWRGQALACHNGLYKGKLTAGDVLQPVEVKNIRSKSHRPRGFVRTLKILQRMSRSATDVTRSTKQGWCEFSPKNGWLPALWANSSRAPLQTSRHVNTIDISDVGILGRGEDNWVCAVVPAAVFSVCIRDPELPTDKSATSFQC